MPEIIRYELSAVKVCPVCNGYGVIRTVAAVVHGPKQGPAMKCINPKCRNGEIREAVDADKWFDQRFFEKFWKIGFVKSGKLTPLPNPRESSDAMKLIQELQAAGYKFPLEKEQTP